MFAVQIKCSSPYKHILSLFNNYFIENMKKLSNNDLDFKIVHLPNKKKRFTLLRSPHVNKKSKEHFLIEDCSFLISFKISKSSLSLIDLILKNVPSEIKLKVKIVEL